VKWPRRMTGLASWLLVTTPFAAAALPSCPQTTSTLYARIRSVSLDPQRVYSVRDASIDRPNLHIDLDDGTLAFTEDICGRITGAFFEGEGEIRLRPPNPAERGSMALFTGMAILDEQFTAGYFRFNDDTAAVLRPSLLPASEPAEFIKNWNDTSRTLADFDALRLLLDFSHFLPAAAHGNEPDRNFPPLLHAHLLGEKLGSFEVFWDAELAEPLWAGQPRMKDGVPFFDVWTSCTPASASPASSSSQLANDVSLTAFRIQAWVQPPTRLQAATEVEARIRTGGERALLFELSRYLKVDAVEADGKAVEFLQNPALEGSELRRKENDLVAVVFPAPLLPGQVLKLHFSYAGDVLSEAGSGLLYVGERGTWYPNFGLSPAQFDMEFHYPAKWTLVATGKQIRGPADEQEKNTDSATEEPSQKIPDKVQERLQEKVSRWTSEKPIPVAGFNLGKYLRADAKVSNIRVEAYGTRGVEKTFPKALPEQIGPPTFYNAPGARSRSMGRMEVSPPPPSPAHDAKAVADKTAKAIESFSQWFGPYPYTSLAMTQMPGNLSQGWPGLVFLSSFAFLNPREQADLHLDSLTRELDDLVLPHETAHQWWGDLVLWKSYRDQWIAEGLANYAALLLLEQKNPVQFHQILEKYRRDLLSKNKDGEWLRQAGPVTLGVRLNSSHFPKGYESISYERGTWLFHMLRCMLRDATLRQSDPHDPSAGDSQPPSRSRNSRLDADEPFFRALRKIRDRYAGKRISTEELVQVFEEELPRPLWYEHRHKLDWFLEGWIEGTAIPQLAARDIHITEKAGVTMITGTIAQKDAPDDLVTAVPVYGATAGNTLVFLGEVLADGPDTAFRLAAPSDVRKIVLDPRQTILAGK
jgi:Peptidase family M1 domain